MCLIAFLAGKKMCLIAFLAAGKKGASSFLSKKRFYSQRDN
ncbi:hypothetical protein LTSEMON_5239 [Salmonella enterica subsp. enterica serovar Montevideo str. S5-403]|uniref:Uncharacterized protein n=1 Tax=Salmonella enterica subsp. enterica serovar Montevideo str. S5-403 TaxID=913242 RepID=G5Q9X3_SALMO|nr:hypothetical protein LTSEMON_5239 [Salmonella enterica subsp. enterica serovar Montevideo str. S5-403]